MTPRRDIPRSLACDAVLLLAAVVPTLGQPIATLPAAPADSYQAVVANRVVMEVAASPALIWSFLPGIRRRPGTERVALNDLAQQPGAPSNSGRAVQRVGADVSGVERRARDGADGDQVERRPADDLSRPRTSFPRGASDHPEVRIRQAPFLAGRGTATGRGRACMWRPRIGHRKPTRPDPISEMIRD